MSLSLRSSAGIHFTVFSLAGFEYRAQTRPSASCPITTRERSHRRIPAGKDHFLFVPESCVHVEESPE